MIAYLSEDEVLGAGARREIEYYRTLAPLRRSRRPGQPDPRPVFVHKPLEVVEIHGNVEIPSRKLFS